MAAQPKLESFDLRVRVDPASALPSLQTIVHDVRVLLKVNGYLGVLVIDLNPMRGLEQECGRDIYNQLISDVAGVLTQLRPEVMREGDLTCVSRPFGEQIVVFLEGARWGTTPSISALEAIADRLWEPLAMQLGRLTRPYGLKESFQLGYALALPNEMIQSERLIYRAVEKARLMADDYSRRIQARGRERLRDLILSRQLATAFQPIVQMNDGAVCAYEALTRGPAGTDLQNPVRLFDLAATTELVSELDRACADNSMANAAALPEGKLLFANVLPSLINDTEFRRRLIDRAVALVDPSRLVLELSEAMAIRNHDLLRKGIDELRAVGIRIAVDDMGAGYANLENVMRLSPDFLKLDISLVRDVHQSPVKQALIESMVSVGKAVSSTVIAEGVETAEERASLQSLGVAWGQGYHFARPSFGFAVPQV